MRFHVLAIPHTVTNKDYIGCAFTQKVLKFCKMMKKPGNYVMHYGHPRAEVECDELVTVIDDDILHKCYGNYDWKKEFFRQDNNDLAYQTFNKNAIEEIRKRKQPNDFILCFWGYGHKPVADAHPDCIVVEPGIGYSFSGTFAKYKVFESYAVMHYIYGRKGNHNCQYDCVIPNYFELEDFTYKDKKQDYFIYLGRIISTKGLHIIIQLAKKLNFRLLIAGQGDIQKDLGYKDLPKNIEYIGFADLEKRKELLANAKAMFLPTYYIEPFGGAAVEAMLSGTPVITTDWGVFSETILHGITGYRCRTFEQFEWAVKNIHKISPLACRQWAEKNYSLDKIKGMYEEYFEMLLRVNKGLDNAQMLDVERKDRQDLNWLYKEYPKKNPEKKLKIALWTRLDWAFGNIAKCLAKYSRHEFTLFSWSTWYPPNTWDKFDLVYVPLWEAKHMFARHYPDYDKRKVIFSVHGHAELLNYDIVNNKNLPISKEAVEAMQINDTVLNFLKSTVLINAIAPKMYDILIEKYKLKNLVFTEQGVDGDLFNTKNHDLETPDKIRVLCTLTKSYKSEHGYNAKRKHLIEAVEQKLADKFTFIWPEKFLSNEAMPSLYKKADVLLCLSHSEGGPLTILEAGACGVISIITDVGHASRVIKNNENGYIITETDEDKIVAQVCDKLTYLDQHRDELLNMKKNIISEINANWLWTKNIIKWDKFFDDAHEKMSKKLTIAFKTNDYIYQMMKRFDKKHNIIKYDLTVPSDLIFVDSWVNALQLVNKGIEKSKLIIHVQTLLELLSVDFNTLKPRTLTKKIVEEKAIYPDLLSFLGSVNTVTVGNKELLDLLKSCDLKNLRLGLYGFDPDKYRPGKIEVRDKIRVVYSASSTHDYGYDVDRYWMIEKIVRKLSDNENIVITENKDYQGDIYLSTLHTDDGRHNTLDACVYGLTPISTINYEFMKGEINYINEETEKKCVNKICELLTELEKDRVKLLTLRINALKESANWKWPTLINNWIQLFETACLNL